MRPLDPESPITSPVSSDADDIEYVVVAGKHAVAPADIELAQISGRHDYKSRSPFPGPPLAPGSPMSSVSASPRGDCTGSDQEEDEGMLSLADLPEDLRGLCERLRAAGEDVPVSMHNPGLGRPELPASDGTPIAILRDVLLGGRHSGVFAVLSLLLSVVILVCQQAPDYASLPFVSVQNEALLAMRSRVDSFSQLQQDSNEHMLRLQEICTTLQAQVCDLTQELIETRSRLYKMESQCLLPSKSPTFLGPFNPMSPVSTAAPLRQVSKMVVERVHGLLQTVPGIESKQLMSPRNATRPYAADTGSGEGLVLRSSWTTGRHRVSRQRDEEHLREEEHQQASKVDSGRVDARGATRSQPSSMVLPRMEVEKVQVRGEVGTLPWLDFESLVGDHDVGKGSHAAASADEWEQEAEEEWAEDEEEDVWETTWEMCDVHEEGMCEWTFDEAEETQVEENEMICWGHCEGEWDLEFEELRVLAGMSRENEQAFGGHTRPPTDVWDVAAAE